jgi:hypothetical protein
MVVTSGVILHCDVEEYYLYLPSAFMLVSCLAYSLTVRMEAIRSSETLVNFQWTIQCALMSFNGMRAGHSSLKASLSRFTLVFTAEWEYGGKLRMD